MALKVVPKGVLNLTAGEKGVLAKINELYENVERVAYLYIQPRIRNFEPDFILIDSEKGVCIIEVKDWSLEYLKAVDSHEVKTADGNTLTNPVRKSNQYFSLINGLFESDSRLLEAKSGQLDFTTYAKVIFTNLRADETKKLEAVISQLPSQYLSSDKLNKLTIGKLFGENSCNLKPFQMETIRAILFPEIKIFDSLKNGSLGLNVDTKGDQTIKALDYEQELFAKRIPFGHYMVSGVPGSGKTVILLARALYLIKENPDWQIKIVTYNRSLATKLEHRLQNIADDLKFFNINYKNISISTFHKLALEVSGLAVPQDAPDVWWSETLPAKALVKAKRSYDAVLVDEYQDFYDDWIKLCLAICKKNKYDEDGETENFFMAGDRLQSIYNPRAQVWKTLGVNVQGGNRSKLLKHTYRSGKTHIEMALDFLSGHPQLREEVEKFYQGRDGIDNQSGSIDRVEFIEGQYKAVEKILNNLIYKVGYKPEDIFILTPTFDEANGFFSRLAGELKEKCKVTKDAVDGKTVITTYHSSKGLEAKICILVNASHFPLSFLAELESRKLFYVAMTRASEGLYIHSANSKESGFVKELKDQFKQK